MLPEILVGDPPTLLDALASLLEADGRAALAARGRFALALSGGSVATTFFPGLAGRRFDWSSTEFFWCDERAVPPSDPESNYAVARALWLEPAGVPTARLHRMTAEVPDLARAADAYADEMVRTLGMPPRLDVALLGVGPDGHVASLFPRHRVLDDERRWVVEIDDSPKPPARRLSLSVAALAEARRLVVAAFGTPKAEIVREALEDPDSRLPLAIVARRAQRVTLLLDEGAASGLRR
jgi:6-phosphogluconolactonase